MRYILKLFFLCVIVIHWTAALTQTKDSTSVGTVRGTVRDTVHNYDLPFVSVAVYYARDTGLISYQLSNNQGAFHFKEMPTDIPLIIRFYSTGYHPATIRFLISAETKTIDLKNVCLYRDEGQLEEVVVRSTPPITMNGDTLEFNASAFRLDKNAVVEDMLRVLPGVTVWSDGSITVNGKQVSHVFVEGKPFFGNDARIATQNISKSAIDKVQVYQQNQNVNNPLDSITNINIKLKQDKNFGHFGKVATGYGTDKRYEADANVNFFNPLTQLGFIGASNNNNIIAGNASTLMRNSTYKGTGINVDYQPDFSLPGINKSNSVGVIFQHDFIPNPDYFKNNRLSGNYFLNKNNNTTIKNIQTITSLGNDSTQIKQEFTDATTSATFHHIHMRYDKKKNNSTFYIAANLTSNDSSHNQSKAISVTDGQQMPLSTSNIKSMETKHVKDGLLEIGLTNKKSIYSDNQRPEDWDIKYYANYDNTNFERTNKTNFKSAENALLDELLNRHYYTTSNSMKQHLFLSIGDFSKWIFGYKSKVMSRVNVKLQNSLDIVIHNENNKVDDMDTLTGIYTANNYLSGNNRFILVNEAPALNLSREINKTLGTRYQKSLLMTLSIQEQINSLNNNSNHAFQDISYSYARFTPNLEVRYSNYQFGDYQDSYNLKFALNPDFPTVAQLVPLVDSSNMYYIQEGNAKLKPTTQKEVTFVWQHVSFRTKNTFNYNVTASAGVIDNSFADSSITDVSGRSFHYAINADGKKYLRISGGLNKAMKFDQNHQLQISFLPTLIFMHTPNSINNVWNVSNSTNFSHSLTLYYSYKTWMTIYLKNANSYYHSRQTAYVANAFNNTLQSTMLNVGVNITKRLSCSSNITYNHNTSTASNGNRFTIWNAYASYRFLSSNNLELKVTALDLLNENTGIVNSGTNNTLSYGSTSTLRQYFMFTVSYFPRKFGQ
ncbi:MAG: hypothetical protein QM610_00165 [Chitinophagaceae bacterium]